MSRRYVSIYCNGEHVRTYGGNGFDVREMYRRYKSMSKEEFLAKHPTFTEICKYGFSLHVWYSGNPETCGIHIVDTKNKMSTVKGGFGTILEANLWALNNLPETEVCLCGQDSSTDEKFRYFVTNERW